MKKRIVTIALVVALLATCFAGTYAYLQDADSAKNTMTMGNVDIDQFEYERVIENGKYVTDAAYGYKLQAFTQDKSLMPATAVNADLSAYNFGAGDWDSTLVKMNQVGSQGSMQMFSNTNALDKLVVVKNSGKSDAYVRTLIAFECGSKTQAEWDALIRSSIFMLDQGVWSENYIGIVTIGDSNYVVYEYIYNGGAHLGGIHANGVLTAGQSTYPSLAQVYMTAAATNADVAALDGNGNAKYDILVLSQGVQAQGFANAELALDTAFGDVNATTAAAWLASIA